MNWSEDLKNQIPDWAKDIRLNLDNVVNRSTIQDSDLVKGVALASAIASGNATVIQTILTDFDNEKERVAAQTASSLMGMNNIWYPYVEMTGDSNLKGLPAQLRMNAYATHGGTSKGNFEAYALAASIVGKCHFCVKNHYDTLKKEGFTVEQLRDLGRIASVINAVTKVINVPSLSTSF